MRKHPYLYYYTIERKNSKEVRDKIKALRNKQGLTQEALAHNCDTSYTTLTKIKVNVISKPSIQTVVKIAAGLGVNVDELIR